ncbi:PAS domain S-box protein [Nodosilinea sp. E11]|uniref:PAS domain S-box protein n=1 Tax=Nodosilinea sp. E11 TaxID=3037479 RepID=UPI0029349531|nr:PAS domain S-box protein [Nodosilinea sp. E11]WOD40005.1 PAS domain S-box protein [Nodosilinea sp. E11]
MPIPLSCHPQPNPSRSRPWGLNTGLIGVGLGLMALGGYLAYQNLADSRRHLLLLALLGGAIALGLLFTQALLAQLRTFNQISRQLAAGNFDQRLPTHGSIRELNDLAESWNQMADHLQQSLACLQTTLNESEAKFATIFRTSPDPIAIATLADGRLLEVNDSLTRLLGYSRSELIGHTALELNLWHSPDARSHYRSQLNAQGHLNNVEVQLRTKTGQIKTGLLSCEVQLLEGQNCVISVLKDISERERLETERRQAAAQLRKTEQWLEQYSQVSPSMIYTFVKTPEGEGWFEYISAAVEVIGEITVEQALQDADLVRGLIHPEDRADCCATEAESEQFLQPFSHQCRILTPSGTLKWVHIQAQPERRTQGQLAWHGVMVDISSHQRSETALHQSEARFRQLAETVREGFFIYEIQADLYSYTNPSYGVVLGITAPQPFYKGTNYWLDRVHEGDRDRLLAALQRERQGENFDEEYRYLRPDGQLRWLRSKAFPLRDQTGNVVRIVGTVEDISDRKQTEIALQESEDRFRRAFDNAPYGIYLVSATGQFVQANPCYCNLLGYSEAELLTLTFKDITHPDDWAADWAEFQRMMAGETHTYRLEKRYLTKQGTVIPVVVNAAPIYDAAGQLLYAVGHVQDSRDRLAIDRMKDEFISVVSHELRTPITSIQGALVLLGAGIYTDRPEKAQRMLNIAISNSDRLVRLVDDILSFERLESGRVQLEPEFCQIRDLIHQAIDSVQALADQSGITLVTSPLSAVLWAAPDAIIQVLTNLLSNAIKFSAAGETVQLQATISNAGALAPTQNPAVIFSVCDRGRGIPPEKLTAIFGQFQQVDASDSRRRGGTGLGLAICKRIVEQHQGRIWVESQVGQGSTFYVALPLKREQPHA